MYGKSWMTTIFCHQSPNPPHSVSEEGMSHPPGSVPGRMWYSSTGQGFLRGSQAGPHPPGPPQHRAPSLGTGQGWDRTQAHGWAQLGRAHGRAGLRGAGDQPCSSIAGAGSDGLGGQRGVLGREGRGPRWGWSGPLKPISVLSAKTPSKNNPGSAVLENTPAQNVLQKYNLSLKKQIRRVPQILWKGKKMLCLLFDLVFCLDLRALSFGKSLLWNIFYLIGSQRKILMEVNFRWTCWNASGWGPQSSKTPAPPQK